MQYIEITKSEARRAYCRHVPVYISTTYRIYWKLPASHEYASHAPIEELFERSIPKSEGKVKFYAKIT